MKKLKALILLIMLLSVISIQGKSQKTLTTTPDTLKLKLLSPSKHSIQIKCVNIDNKFFFIDDLNLSQQDIADNKLCFFLNADFTISDILIKGKSVPLKMYKNVLYDDFIPAIDKDVFASVSNKCNVYEIVFDNVLNLHEQLDVKMKYHFLKTDSLTTITDSSNGVDFIGTEFWYPRNLNQDENLSLYVDTIDTTSFYLNGKQVDYEQKRYLKKYSISLKDKKENPAVLMFRKSGLK